MTKNLAKCHYDQVNEIEGETEKKEGRKGRKRIKINELKGVHKVRLKYTYQSQEKPWATTMYVNSYLSNT